MTSAFSKSTTSLPRVAAAVSWILACALIVVGPAMASAQGGRISGAGISKVGKDTRKLTVAAESGGSTANGSVQFIHNSPSGMSRFRGSVSCMNVSGGTVQVSGTVEKGETVSGTLLDGKSYAITIQAGGSPQSFSLPSFGEPASAGSCSGGRAETVPVTEDGFRIQ
ncbi:MAG: hypothetical protein H0U59_11935 [Gemmatimonadaceae bacterium]|nr:hypothetical protein [Gemmatimonadaceae bacterium]